MTILIISYNHAPYVAQALESAFAQTYGDCSVLIFDDASTDDTVARIRDYLDQKSASAAFVHHTINRGLCSTLNEALERVATEFVAFISADDWMEPTRIEEQVKRMNEVGPEYGAVYSDAYCVDANGKRLPGTVLEVYNGPRRAVGDIFIDLLRTYHIPASSVLVRRSVYSTVGGYDEALPFEDHDMWLRIARSFKFAYVPQALVSYRDAPNSLTHVLLADRAGWARMRMRILRKHLGVSAEADGIIFRRIAIAARRLYLSGASPKEVRRDLWLGARHARSLTSMLYVGAATFGIPGAWIVRARSLAGRRVVRAQSPANGQSSARRRLSKQN